MLSTRIIDLSVIIAYLILLLAIGVIVKRMSRNTSDYFRSGCKASWWLAGSTAFMATLSAWTFTGAAGVAFESGWSILLIYLGGVFGLIIQALFLAAWFRQMRATTVPEIIRERFNRTTQQIYAYLQVFSQVLLGAIALYGLAIFIGSIFALPIEPTIIVLGLSVLVYSALGGSWAVMATSFVQGLIVFTLVVVLSVVCLIEIGGISGLFQQIQLQGLSESFRLVKSPGEIPGDKFTLGWIMALMALQFMGGISMIESVRYFGVKDGREARKSAFFAAIMSALGLFLWFIPPITARLLFPEAVVETDISRPSESAFAIASLQLLPVGMIGLMAVCVISTTLSSLDVALNRNAAVIVKDMLPAIYSALKYPLPKESTLLRLGEVVTSLLGITLIIIAISLSRQPELGIFEIMQLFTSLVAVPLVVPLALAILFRRVPAWSALISLATGIISSLIALNSATIFGQAWTFQTTTFINIASTSTAFILSGFFWKNSPADYKVKVDQFFQKMKTPVDFETEVGEGNDNRQLALLGGFCLLISALGLVLLVFQRSWFDAALVASFCLIIGSVGGLLYWKSK